MDLLYIILIIGFFALSGALVGALDLLRGPQAAPGPHGSDGPGDKQ